MPLPRRPISPLAGRLSTNVRAIRRRLGWSQTKVAKAAGISLVSYSRIETGRQLPTLPRVDAIAKVLGVPITMLLSVSDVEGTRLGALHDLVQGMTVAQQDFVFGLVAYCSQQWGASGKQPSP